MNTWDSNEVVYDLKSIVALAIFLLCSKGGQFKLFSMLKILERSLYTNLANRCCTILSLLISHRKCGDQTIEACSSIGLT